MAKNTPQTWLGGVMGDAYSAQAEFDKAQWHTAIDASHLNMIGVPFTDINVASALHWIVDQTYNPKIDNDYNTGVAIGDKTYSDYFGKIQDTVTQLQTYANKVRNDLTNTLNNLSGRADSLSNQISSIQASVNDAISKVKALDGLVNTAQSDILNLKTRVASLEKTGVPTKTPVSSLFPKLW